MVTALITAVAVLKPVAAPAGPEMPAADRDDLERELESVLAG